MFPKFFQDNAQPNISVELLENAMDLIRFSLSYFTSRIISQESALGSQGAPSYRVFSMEELEKATEKFDKSALLGEGSIGKVPMATDSVDVLERIASQLFTTTHEQQFNKEEIQVVSYRNKLFADVKSEPLLDASVPNMDVVINAPVSGGISLIPSSLSQASLPTHSAWLSSVGTLLPLLATHEIARFLSDLESDFLRRTPSCAFRQISSPTFLVDTQLDALIVSMEDLSMIKTNVYTLRLQLSWNMVARPGKHGSSS
ncbi:hypothetical protein FXO38_30419 [Capsicum annuum]|uniref:Uncharacterized protein n=1 Tax=Capsicum annuum TaxID=4072 RepID=A0A2G2Z7Z0_CAPAN|nr:hypothetical protein FXO38_30419 [Capsicum annuum]PHT78089.1 hypothetical protein T459_16141 [Capsicum annuum]